MSKITIGRKAVLTGLLLLSAAMIGSAPLGAAAAAPDAKVQVCHVPPDNPANAHFISVAAAAVPAHVAHGDQSLTGNGACSVGVGECRAAGSLICTAQGLVCDATPLSPPEPTEASCTDGLDNDCDGLIDAQDNDCAICDPTTDVEFGGKCYYLDGSAGQCQPGDVLAPQSILGSIAPSFVGKTYKTQVSGNCCIVHADEATEGQDWGMNANCNVPGPFTAGNPVLDGAHCTNANNHDLNQLTLCQTP